MCRPNTALLAAARQHDCRPRVAGQVDTEAQSDAATCSKAPGGKGKSQDSSDTNASAQLFAAACLGAPIPPSPAAASICALLDQASKSTPVPETRDIGGSHEPAQPPRAAPKRKRMRHQVSFGSRSLVLGSEPCFQWAEHAPERFPQTPVVPRRCEPLLQGDRLTSACQCIVFPGGCGSVSCLGPHHHCTPLAPAPLPRAAAGAGGAAGGPEGAAWGAAGGEQRAGAAPAFAGAVGGACG